MSKRQHLFRFSILLCWMLLTCGLGMVAQHQVAHAASASLPPGYSLTVTESTSTITYGDTALTITAQLTIPTGEHPLSNPALFNFKIDSQDYGADRSTGSDPTYTFILKGVDLSGAYALSAGQHTVVATYYSIPLQETLESDPISLTVQKFSPSVGCLISWSTTFGTNASFSFQMASIESGDPTIDWQGATYTITFIGSQTFTDTGLAVDKDGYGTALTPPVPGRYEYRCAFNGTTNFNPAQSVLSTLPMLVTAGHQPGIKLYSNPTTIKGGQSTTLEIVVTGTSGSPTPTGQVSLSMGNAYTKDIDLGSNGKVEIQTTFPSPLPLPGDSFWVHYLGDTVYAATDVNFPLTNPSIPGGGPQPTPAPVGTPTGSSTPGAGSTPTPSGTAIATGGTPAPSSTTIANVGTVSGNQSTGSTSNQGNMLFWVALVALLLLAAGGIGAIVIVLRKRARAAPIPARTRFPFDDDF